MNNDRYGTKEVTDEDYFSKISRDDDNLAIDDLNVEEYEL